MSILTKFRSFTSASHLQGTFLALFIILGLGYSFLTPVFENSDETLHYPYIKHLADGHGLPLAIPDQLWNQEGTQPPLYYTIVAATTFWIDTDNLADLLHRNPHWLFTEVRILLNDNQNLVLHPPQQDFPYRRAALAIHIGRWWSLLFGLITVLTTFHLSRYLFPQNLPLIITATTLTTFNPQFLRVSATVSNDSLSAALTTLAIFLTLKWSDSPSKTDFSPLHYPIGLGILSGLALLTKLSSLSTIFVIASIIIWRFRQQPRIIIQWLTIISGLTLLLTGWWFWRNYHLYGEWLATETHLNLAGRNHIPLLEVWRLRLEAERAYWATFGWGQIRPPEGVYQLLFWFTRLGLLGVIIKIIQLVRQKLVLPLEKIALLLLWTGLNIILYLRWVMEVGSVSHTRLIFPAIAAISLLLALGWHTFLPRSLEHGFSSLMMGLFVALNIYSLGWLIKPAFTPFHADDPPLNPIQITFLDQKIKLVESQIYTSDGDAAHQGEAIMLKIGWEIKSALDKNYSVAASILAPDGTVLAQRETYPGLGLRPTHYLPTGTHFTDIYPLLLTQEITEPMVAQATVTLFDFDSPDRAGFPAFDRKGQIVTPFVGSIKIVPTRWPIYHPNHTEDINFSDTIRLIGYDQDETETGTELTFYWQTLKPPEGNYIVFIHLLDEKGEVISQADAPPTHSRYPTPWWDKDEIIADRHLLPPEAATTLRFGLYNLDSEQRLSIIESTLPVHNDSVEIALP